MLSLANVLLDFLISGLEASPGPQHDLGTGAASQADAIGLAKMIDDLAMGHAALLVEMDDGGLSIGTDLTGRGPDRIAGLQRMPAMHASATIATGPLVDDDDAINRLDGDVFLELKVDFIVLGNVAAAIGTVLGQRCIEHVIDLVCRRFGTLAMLAVRVAFGPSRGFGIVLGFPLGERSGLAFGSPPSFVS